MTCFVYRSKKNSEMYLYLPEKEQFSNVPDSLLKLVGEVEFSFEFILNTERKLLRYEAVEVMRNILDNGFFLQMPPNGYRSDNSGVLGVDLQGF
ncbi:MAG: YcgL domain-containing protein [Cocleimonas sp.]|nr:YcgL domain-containing protein [Cocleimonas sp.]